MKELAKELILAWINRPKATAEEVERDVWRFVVKAIVILVVGIGFGALWLIGFEDQAESLAPIDSILLEILKAIAFMGVGAMAAISGYKPSTAKKDEV